MSPVLASRGDLSRANLDQTGLPGAERAHSEVFDVGVGEGATTPIQVTRLPGKDPEASKFFRGRGLALVALGTLTLTQTAPGIIISTMGNDAISVQNGLNESLNWRVGSASGNNPAAGTPNGDFVTSVTFLTDSQGNRYQIASMPPNDTMLVGAGVGDHGISGQPSQGQDGNVRLGMGRKSSVISSYNPALYGGLFFEQNSPDGILGDNWDSGGEVRVGDSVLGVMTAQLATRTVFSSLAPMQGFLDQHMTDPDGIYLVTAAHAAVGTDWDSILVGNFNTPAFTLEITDCWINPGFQAGFGGLDGNASDIALLKAQFIPEPSGLMAVTACFGGSLLARRRRLSNNPD